MEAICSSETSADFQRITRCYIPEDAFSNCIDVSTSFEMETRGAAFGKFFFLLGYIAVDKHASYMQDAVGSEAY
jgi:hypothetical protein